MIVGSRVLYPEEVSSWNAEIFQISVYRGMKKNLEHMKNCALKCREVGIPYVVHPVSYFLLDETVFKDMREMARWSDRALILHDEKSPRGGRLEGEDKIRFRNNLKEITSITDVSFENATDTGDVQWFWNNFAESITLDIGHVESSGYDSVAFVKNLADKLVSRIQYVHIHRNNGLHGGITDHWPLSADCRELSALRELVKRKPDVNTILEINEIDQIGQNLEILRTVRDELKIGE